MRCDSVYIVYIVYINNHHKAPCTANIENKNTIINSYKIYPNYISKSIH